MNITPLLKPGLSIRAKHTITNINCGINPDFSRGNICYIDDSGISIYFEKGSGRGYFEAIISPEVFAMNFEEDRVRPDNPTYSRYFHFHKRYPDVFL
jgi:hypothetical protein